MGNLITIDRFGPDHYLQMSNGATTVLLYVLLLGGSDSAASVWEQQSLGHGGHRPSTWSSANDIACADMPTAASSVTTANDRLAPDGLIGRALMPPTVRRVR